MLDAPVLTALAGGERAKRRPVSLRVIPERMTQAVLAIEDRRFFEHPGVDPIGIVGAILSNLRGKRAYTAGASTITQQVARNVFLPKMFPGMTLKDAREKSLRRKLLEVWVAAHHHHARVEGRDPRDVPERHDARPARIVRHRRRAGGVAAVLRQGRQQRHARRSGDDRRRLSVAVRAVAVQQPRRGARSGATSCCRRWSTPATSPQEAADRAVHEPLVVVQRALEAEAPYFVDYVGQTLADQYPGLTTTTTEAVDVYTTLDLHLQRLAQDAVRDGLTRVDQLLSRRKRRGKAEAALIAVDPRSGEILAFVGGRSYNQSQLQPGDRRRGGNRGRSSSRSST